jgi:hypothetical protein
MFDDDKGFWICVALALLVCGVYEITQAVIKSAENREAMRSGYEQKVDEKGNVIWVKDLSGGN